MHAIGSGALDAVKKNQGPWHMLYLCLHSSDRLGLRSRYLMGLAHITWIFIWSD